MVGYKEFLQWYDVDENSIAQLVREMAQWKDYKLNIKKDFSMPPVDRDSIIAAALKRITRKYSKVIQQHCNAVKPNQK